MGIWTGVEVSIREINLWLISNERHRWSRKNEGISLVEKRISANSTSCPSPIPRGVTQSYTRELHQAYLTFSGPPIDCHTCSYMDSEGKCLRGEGSCTLQNSQQCMLKKIFEGIGGTSWGDLCQQTHEYSWRVVGWQEARAWGGDKLCFPETWKFNETLSFQVLRVEFQFLLERESLFPAGLKRRQGEWLSLLIKEIWVAPWAIDCKLRTVSLLFMAI